jgi:hypothetical protein
MREVDATGFLPTKMGALVALYLRKTRILARAQHLAVAYWSALRREIS